MPVVQGEDTGHRSLAAHSTRPIDSWIFITLPLDPAFARR
jgi:hypothetical protein